MSSQIYQHHFGVNSWLLDPNATFKKSAEKKNNFNTLVSCCVKDLRNFVESLIGHIDKSEMRFLVIDHVNMATTHTLFAHGYRDISVVSNSVGFEKQPRKCKIKGDLWSCGFNDIIEDDQFYDIVVCDLCCKFPTAKELIQNMFKARSFFETFSMLILTFSKRTNTNDCDAVSYVINVASQNGYYASVCYQPMTTGNSTYSLFFKIFNSSLIESKTSQETFEFRGKDLVIGDVTEKRQSWMHGPQRYYVDPYTIESTFRDAEIILNVQNDIEVVSEKKRKRKSRSQCETPKRVKTVPPDRDRDRTITTTKSLEGMRPKKRLFMFQ